MAPVPVSVKDIGGKPGARLLAVLQAVSLADEPIANQEIAAKLGLDKSTVSRYLAFLEEGEYVARDQKSRRYLIGPTMLALAAAVGKRAEILRLVRPYLEDIRTECGETTSYHLRVGLDRICVDAADRFPPQIGIRPLGVQRPLFAGTAGRVILAFINDEDTKAVFERAHTNGVDVEALRKNLDSCRSGGFLISRAERSEPTITMSCPLFSGHTVFGAITVTGPIERFDFERAEEYAPRLRTKAREISAVVSAAGIPTFQGNHES